jgi:hypothetical protein
MEAGCSSATLVPTCTSVWQKTTIRYFFKHSPMLCVPYLTKYEANYSSTLPLCSAVNLWCKLALKRICICHKWGVQKSNDAFPKCELTPVVGFHSCCTVSLCTPVGVPWMGRAGQNHDSKAILSTELSKHTFLEQIVYYTPPLHPSSGKW